MYMYVYLGNGLWDILCDVSTAIHNLDQAHTAWCFYFSKMRGALMSIAIKMSHNGVKICCLITTPSKSMRVVELVGKVTAYSVDCKITEVDNLWLQPVPVLFRIEFQNETAVMNIKPKVSYARSFDSTTEEVNTRTVSLAVMVVCSCLFPGLFRSGCGPRPLHCPDPLSLWQHGSASLCCPRLQVTLATDKKVCLPTFMVKWVSSSSLVPRPSPSCSFWSLATKQKEWGGLGGFITWMMSMSTSLVHRLLFAKRENGLVNCLYCFSSKSRQLDCEFKTL